LQASATPLHPRSCSSSKKVHRIVREETWAFVRLQHIGTLKGQEALQWVSFRLQYTAGLI
jgi:hypothetical protein